MSDSLCKLADALGRSQKTINRWCARGLVRGAYRTRGGHWRIRSGYFFENRFRLNGKVPGIRQRYINSPEPEIDRKIKTDPEFAALMQRASAAALYNAEKKREIDAALRYAIADKARPEDELVSLAMAGEEIPQGHPDNYFTSEISVSRLLDLEPRYRAMMENANGIQIELLTAALELRRKELPITSGEIAKRMGISRRSIYNPPLGLEWLRIAKHAVLASESANNDDDPDLHREDAKKRFTGELEK